MVMRNILIIIVLAIGFISYAQQPVKPMPDSMVVTGSITIPSKDKLSVGGDSVITQGEVLSDVETGMGYLLYNSVDTLNMLLKDSTDLAFDEELQLLQLAGSGIKMKPPFCQPSNAWTNLVDGTEYYIMFMANKSFTIDSVVYYLAEDGVFTGDNFNGFKLYEIDVSDWSLTEVGTTANDENIWKGDDYAPHIAAFTSTITITRGLYMLQLVYNSSAETTAPQLVNGQTFTGIVQRFDIGAPFKLSGVRTYSATAPANLSEISENSRMIYLYLK